MYVQRLLAITLALLTGLAGCGQKGALYREHQDASAVMAPASGLPDNSEVQSRKDTDK